MAVPTDAVTEQVFVGAGTASALSTSFKFIGADDLVITAIVAGEEDPEPLVRGVDYTVAGGNGGTGSVTPAAAIPVGTSWRVRRETPLGQPATLPSGSFQPQQIESAIDRQAFGLQEQAREVSRTIRAQRGEAGPLLAPLATLEGKIPVFEGGEVRPGPDVSEVEQAFAGALGDVATALGGALDDVDAARVQALEDVADVAAAVAPTAGPFIVPAEAIVSDRAYPIQVAVLNGLGFTRAFMRLTMEGETGSVEVMVLVNGVAVTPLIVLTHGESTTVVSVTVPPGGVLELWFGTIIGTPLGLFGKLEGPAA